MDLARQHLRVPSRSGPRVRIEPAGTVAHVADCSIMRACGRIQESLAAFARLSSCAALDHVIHGARVELNPLGGDGALTYRSHNVGAASRGNAGVGCAVGIDPEGLVFFNDPAVVSDGS